MQDLIRANKAQLYPLINDQGAVVHLCGSVAMGSGIRAALVDVLKLGPADPETILLELEKSNRYVNELWG